MKQRKSLSSAMVELFTAFMLSVMALLAADTLYSYYAGSWTEPVLLIRYAELGCLYALVLGSLALSVYYYRRGFRDNR